MSPWARSCLAASAGYLAFAFSVAFTFRLFEPELSDDHGGLMANLMADLGAGLVMAGVGLVLIIGILFWIAAVVWARLQLSIITWMNLNWWLPSAFIGLPVGAGAGYLFYIGVLIGAPDRPWFGPVLSGCIAGVLAGIALVTPWERARQSSIPSRINQ